MSAEFSQAVLDLVHERSGGMCEICSTEWDEKPAQEHHHRRGRGAGGTKRASSATAAACLHLCRDCHRLAEKERRVALLLGWAVSQHMEPSCVPVMRRGEWVYLNDNAGGFERVATPTQEAG